MLKKVRQVLGNRAALALMAGVVYLLAFMPLYRLVGTTSTVLVGLPVVVTEGLFGMWAGLLTGLLALPLSALFVTLAGGVGWDVVLRGLPGFFLMILVGAVVGRQRDLREQARWEIAERQRVEEELRKHHDHLEELVEERTAEIRRANEELEAEIAERKRAGEALRQHTAQLEALRHLGLELTAQLDLDALLHSIASRAVELSGGTSGGLFLYRPERDVMEWTVAIGVNPATIGAVLHRGEGLCGRVWETCEPLIVDDYHQWEGRVAGFEGLPFAAVMGVPVHWGEEVLGVLEVDVAPPRTFSPADAELLSLFATQAAIAIRNARLYEQAQREITERKRAEGALRESEQWLSTMLRSIGDAVIATDAKGFVTLMNPIAEDLTGWNEIEAVGKLLEDVFNIINEQTGERAENPVARVIREGVVVGLANHTVLIAKDGMRWPIADSGAPMRGEEGKIIGTVLVFRDITERRRTEQALAQRVQELERFNRLAVGRELRMIELKRQINELSEQLGKEPPYDVSFVEENMVGGA